MADAAKDTNSAASAAGQGFAAPELQSDADQVVQAGIASVTGAAAAAGTAASAGSETRLETHEDFARALREAEERTARLLARLRHLHENAERGGEDEEDDDDDSSDASEDFDPDNMSYEELIALGEAVGTESRGLAPSTIAKLPVSCFRGAENGSSSDCEQCVICRHEYEHEVSVLTLPCNHKYHPECIQQWLQINKVCPVCSAEVGSS